MERLGRYRLLEELGSGGTSTVYLAREAAKGSAAEGPPVALKVIHPHLSSQEDFCRRFTREARLGLSVQHPNVVRVLDVGVAERRGQPVRFLVMEYVEGQTLRSLLAELGFLSEDLCLHVAHEAAKALAGIHAVGIVHRDVKPDNILITRDEGVKLMDLGVAFLESAKERLSRAGQFVGSVLYAAPEQIRGGGPPVGPQADLYGLGLTLYELSTGVHPFADDDIGVVVRRQLFERPAPPSEERPQLSPFFETLVMALLEKAPDRRIASASELLSILEEREESSWWKTRSSSIPERTKRSLMRVRVPGETSLLGRSVELGTLGRLFEDVRSQRGRVVLVEGEAGIGKTRLVDEFVARLDPDGRRVHFLRGAYPSCGAATAAGGFCTAYREHFGADRLESDLTRYLGPLSSLAPALAALLRGETAPTGGNRLEVDSIQTAFLCITRALAQERPVILVLDDLHFAPQEGRGLFAALAQGVVSHRVMLVATTRPGLDEEWVAGLDRLEHEEHMLLGRLSEDDVRDMVAETLGSSLLADRLGEAIAARSDGNPYFVLELLRALQAGGFLVREDSGRWTAVGEIGKVRMPTSLRGLVTERIAHLAMEERELLEMAACAGFCFDPSVVARALGESNMRILMALGRLERRHRIVRATGRTYSFDHHLVREVLEEDLPLLLQEEYHGALADSIVGERTDSGQSDVVGASAVALVEHLLRARRHEEAVRYLGPALEHLSQGYLYAEAAELARRVLELPGAVRGRQRVPLLLRQATNLEVLGRRSEELEVLEEADRLVRPLDDPGLRRTILRRLGLYHRISGDPMKAMGYLRAAQALAEERCEREECARISGDLGNVLADLGRFEEARAHLREHLRVATATDDRLGEARAQANLAILAYQEGDCSQALHLHAESIERFREAGQRRFEGLAIGNLGVTHNELGHREQARRCFEEQLRIAMELGDRPTQAMALGNLGMLSRDEGDFEAALAYTERDLEITGEIAAPSHKGSAMLNRSLLMLGLGEIEEAKALATRALEIVKSVPSPFVEMGIRYALGQVFEAEGDEEAARREYERDIELQREMGSGGDSLAGALSALGHLLIRRGARSDAQRVLQEASSLTPNCAPRTVVEITCLQAELDSERFAIARQALGRSESMLSPTERLSAWYGLWRASGLPAYLHRAKGLLYRSGRRVPKKYRENYLRRIPMHRDVLESLASSGQTVGDRDRIVSDELLPPSVAEG